MMLAIREYDARIDALGDALTVDERRIGRYTTC
jgi:hypothetical protein